MRHVPKDHAAVSARSADIFCVSLVCTLQSALSGFAYVNICGMLHPDTLHQDHQGMARRLVARLEDVVQPAQFERINQQLLRTHFFPGQSVHRKGFSGNGITAHVAHCMLQRLPAAVLTLAKRGSLTEPVEHYLQALTSARSALVQTC